MTIHEKSAGVPHKGRSLLIWAAICAAAGLIWLIYVSASSASAAGNLILPLDDAYIHFQYAHQIAQGEIYVYNPGLPPTSGATSFLYPYLLAVGDLIGFRALSLAYWATGIGALALAISGGLIWQIGRRFSGEGFAFGFALTFMINGATAWHFMSGMETGLAALFVLLTLYGVFAKRDAVILMGASLSALIRPEGAILAALVVAYLIVNAYRAKQPIRWWWFVPLAAAIVQPLVNALVTGSAVATGNAAKSLFGVVPFDFGYTITRIWQNFTRAFAEAFAIMPDQPFYLGTLAALLALGGLLYLLGNKKWRGVALVLGLWLIGSMAAISTLDTAFWHFKRYQMPLIAGLFALAVIGGAVLTRRTWLKPIALMGAAWLALMSAQWFLQSYAVNVSSVYRQPYQMAEWLSENAPDDAVIAVHDVGMMRYIGGHTTLDIVGLTTPGAADYWRNGPGSVGEYILRERPDMIASYGEGHGLGLGYLAETDLYSTRRIGYRVELDPARNVALAAADQGIYQPQYDAASHQPDLDALPGLYLDVFSNMNWIDSLNVADLESERANGYSWTANGALGGFPTEFYQFQTFGCVLYTCLVMDGGRRITGEESFTLTARAGEDAVLISRIHAANRGTFDVYANETFVGTRVIPDLPGSWFEVATFIPGALITADQVTIRIVPNVPGGAYQPYYHWLFASYYPPVMMPESSSVTFQDGAIELAVRDASGAVDPLDNPNWISYGTVTLRLTWFTPSSASGDYAYFIHIYPADDSTRIVKQVDSRPGGGMLPPGNWLPGAFRDTIEVNVSDLPAGRYRVAIGLYDPVTFARLTPSDGDEEDRYWIGEFERQ